MSGDAPVNPGIGEDESSALPAEAAPGIRNGRALTIKTDRLAGSARCLNCGTDLKGPFCYYCGQPDKNLLRFFPALMREIMEDFLDFDSRFMRTMKPLLFIPGKLTRDYLDGRRFRYTPPLRLYIISSMAFFIMAAMLAGDAVSFGSSEVTDSGESSSIHIGVDEEAELDEVRDALEKIDPDLAAMIDLSDNPPPEAEQDEEDSAGFSIQADDDVISFNDEPWDRETNPLIIPFLPDFINEWINDEIEESPQKGKEIEANPNLILDKVFDVLPATMFVLLPIVALLFKFWYLFAKKYYVEHLIHALHNHSFIFVVFILLMLINSLAGALEPQEDGPVSTAATWANVAIFTWLPVYFLLALKRVYQQGWPLTIGKYIMIGISYFALLAFATSVVALTSFVLL
jgi:hypothetical protein